MFAFQRREKFGIQWVSISIYDFQIWHHDPWESPAVNQR